MRQHRLPVIVLTAQAASTPSINAMRAGAVDFLVKPASPERIKVSIRNALEDRRARRRNRAASRRKPQVTLTFDDLVAKRPACARDPPRQARRRIQHPDPDRRRNRRRQGTDRARHPGRRASAPAEPFVTVNCGAIPENLVESILFGHEKGSFTGATDKHIGKFQEADGGTLFLDEVGELPLDVQVKLLRALQEGEVDPVGAKRPVKVDVRIISATNRDLIAAGQGRPFREDLYYRLNVFPIYVPPLRDRREDVPALARHFVARFAAEEGKRVAACRERGDANCSTPIDWPGNVRQLENAVFRAVVLADGTELTVDDSRRSRPTSTASRPEIPAAPTHLVQTAGLHRPGSDRRRVHRAAYDRIASRHRRAGSLGIQRGRPRHGESARWKPSRPT